MTLYIFPGESSLCVIRGTPSMCTFHIYVYIIRYRKRKKGDDARFFPMTRRLFGTSGDHAGACALRLSLVPTRLCLLQVIPICVVPICACVCGVYTHTRDRRPKRGEKRRVEPDESETEREFATAAGRKLCPLLFPKSRSLSLPFFSITRR